MEIITELQSKILSNTLKEIADNPFNFGDAESLLNVVYWNYAENKLMDNQKIKDGFTTLREHFPYLTMQDFDPVFNTVSELCLEHERGAFLDGIRLGVLLMKELHE